jgi:HSP20 family protein
MKRFAWIFSVVLFSASAAFAQVQNDQDASMEQAKQDYRIFLQQLKQLNSQYKEVTNQMREVIREEGVPSWDMGDGETVVPGVSPSATPGSFADADIRETEKELIVKIDLPGMQKDKISVKIEDFKLLRVKGERDGEKISTKNSADAKYSRVERQHGAFERVIELPALVDDKKPQAKYENGVLTITLTKLQPKKEVTVPIQ